MLLPALLVQLTFAGYVVGFFYLAAFAATWPVALHELLLDCFKHVAVAVILYGMFNYIESFLIQLRLKLATRQNVTAG